MYQKRSFLFLACTAGLGLGLLCATGCKKEGSAPAGVKANIVKAINSKCPVCGMAVNADVVTQDFGKAMVGFCSDGCSEKWTKMGFEEQQMKLDEAMSDN